VSLVIVDYLQLIRARDHGVKRHEQIGEQTAALKGLAKEMECPVLCLAQLNREADGQEPKLSHLRESGSIEQDADMVLAIDRADGSDEANLLVLKHRAGEVGKIPLKWDGPGTRFVDPDDCFANFNNGNDSHDARNLPEFI
jgi:replicative DNA helicase